VFAPVGVLTGVTNGRQMIPVNNKAAASIPVSYFKDLDGHNLEIIHFTQGKGEPRWQRQTDKFFLGIDHTAIVVFTTGHGLQIYRDLLGLQVAGEMYKELSRRIQLLKPHDF
jgi:hypothetical protein